MPTPRHKVTHNPIPTSLFCFNMLFVCIRQNKQFGEKISPEACSGKEIAGLLKNKMMMMMMMNMMTRKSRYCI